MNLPRLLSAALLIASLPLAARAEMAAPSPAERIAAFYAFYVKSIDKHIEPTTDRRAAMTGYISARFLKEVDRLSKTEDGMDADPFICAQDFDLAWASNVTIKEVKIKGDVATARVTLHGGQMEPHHLKLSLVKETGAWKIDRIEDLDLRRRANVLRRLSQNQFGSIGVVSVSAGF